MTISSTVRIAGPFIGTGTATVFPFAFKVFTASNLQVVRVDTSTGLESTLVLTTDYTVSLNADQDSNPGGNVTLLAVLATGFNMVITSDIANLQPTDLTNQGGFYPEVITDALDRATIQIQQMADELTRSIKIPISDGLSLDMELPSAAARANSFLAFDATGEPTVVTAGSPGSPTSITRQQFSGTGAQVAFTLASDPGALGNSCEVFIGGIYQQRDTYTIAGTTLTFTAAPVAGTDNIEIVNFLTSAIGTTDSSLVTFVPAGTGATMRTAQAKMRDTVSVKDFGAVGDGVADDTAEIQACYTANQGKEISHGDGFTYLISAGLTLYSGSKYVGKSVIKQKNAAAIAGPMMTGTSVSNCVVQDIEINGNAANNAAALTFGIKFIGGTNNLVNNCNVHDTTQAGIYFASESYSKVIDNHVINCGRNLGTDDHGIMLISNTSTPLTSIVCQGNTVTGANRKGITVYNASPGVVQGVTIENNIVTGCILGGIYVSNAGAVTHGYFNGIAVVGNRCYNNYVNIEADSMKSGVVSGNTCDTTTGGAGVYLSDCLYSTVSANSITNSQADGIKIIGSTVTSTGMTVSGNSISLSSQSGTGTYSGINFNAVTYSSVVGNVILGESASPKQKYGIEEIGASDYNLFSSNRIANMSTSISLSAVGNNNVFQSTIGKLTALNTATPLNTLDINGGLSLRDQSITLANGANNNVTLPANAGTLYVAGPTGAYSIQGIAGGSQGRKLTIVNYTTQTMTVNYNDAGATAGNRILIGGLANLAITQYGSIDLIYINGASAWVVTGYKA